MKESERIIGLYERHAGAFNRRRGRALFQKAWLDRFAVLAANGFVLEGHRADDAECGGATVWLAVSS